MHPPSNVLLAPASGADAYQTLIQVPKESYQVVLPGDATALPGCAYVTLSSEHTNVRVLHSCSPNAILYDGSLVPQTRLEAGAQVTVNVNLLFYNLEDTCHLDAASLDVTKHHACSCGTPACCVRLAGFASIAKEQQQAASFYASPSVRDMALNAGSLPTVSRSDWVVLQSNAMGLTTYARRCIPKGQVVFHETGVLFPFPTMHTIQVSEALHLSFSGGAEFLAHSCDPNVQVEVDSTGYITVIALREIPEGTMVAFNYLTTEWDMHSTFQCLCGSAQCFGNIRGYRHIQPTTRQAELETLITSVLRHKRENVRKGPESS